MQPTFLIFSGHNERAVVTLCRYFTRAGLRVAIVSGGPNDAIHRTEYARQVVFERIDRVVDVGLLAHLARCIEGRLVYCPTTEFINDFVLRHRDELSSSGLQIDLPPREAYDTLTGKWSSQAALAGLPGLRLVPSLPFETLQAPCVIKPFVNTAAGRVHYPVLCTTPRALNLALGTLEREHYFAQPFISGQSYYLCAYLGRDGRAVSYWQENLLQQPGGKSIVLARSCANPGLDEAALFARLSALGYHGPLMLEVIGNEDGLHYIEINPRFWGPLQLALDTCPELLRRFAAEAGATGLPLAATTTSSRPHYFAWSHGARTPELHHYPSARSLADTRRLLCAHDIYAGADTAALHACH